MSSISSNENGQLAREAYYSAQLHQQQQQSLQFQYNQQSQISNYNNNNHSLRAYSNGTSSNGHSQVSYNNQHPTVFQIYNDPSISSQNNYMSNIQLGMMANNSSSNSPTPNSLFMMNGNGSSVNSQTSYSSIQHQIQQDWTNREYIGVILSNIKKLTDFLNSFELSCKSKLALLDEKLTKLEKQIDFIEAKVTKGDTLN